MTQIANLSLRGLQVFFGVVVLGLAGHLVATQVYGGAPSATNYQVFLGIYILVIAFLGLAASFVGFLQGIIMVGLDAFGILLTFAGGVAYAAQLHADTCSCSLPNQSCPRLVNNSIINGGKNGKGEVDLNVNRVSRCRQAQATTAFVWFAFATFAGAFFLSFVTWRRGGVR